MQLHSDVSQLFINCGLTRNEKQNKIYSDLEVMIVLNLQGGR